MSTSESGRRRAIACAYCGGQHGAADEVKACWQRTAGKEVAPASDELPHNLFDDEPAAARAAGQVVAHVVAGPPALGRNVIVSPGQAAPSGWVHALRIVVEPADGELVARLLAMAMDRTGCVLEVGPDTDTTLARPFTTTLPPHAVGPRVRFTSEQLQHLVFSNSIDVRATPTWALIDQAVNAGAHPVSDGRGDYEMADGTRAWLDGGPVRFTAPIDGVPVVHRVVVEHRSLRPPRNNETEAAVVRW